MAIFLTLLKSLLFEWKSLNIKRITDRGLPATSALYYERLALFPALLLLIFTFKMEYVRQIFSHPLFIVALFTGFFFWIIQEYIGFYLIGSAQNLAFLSAFYAAIALPVSALIGWAINYDRPSPLMVIALIILSAAMLLRPVPRTTSPRAMFQKGILLTAGIAFLEIVVNAANNALGRLLLVNIQGTLFLIGLFTSISMLSIYVFFIFQKPPPIQKAERDNKFFWFAYSIPALWFLGSIPEGYSMARIPIFAIGAISSVTLLITIGSDLRNKRISWNARTAAFAVLVISGVVLAALATA